MQNVSTTAPPAAVCALCKKPFDTCACDSPAPFALVVVLLTEAGRAALRQN
jgi:hypothetical protein